MFLCRKESEFRKDGGHPKVLKLVTRQIDELAARDGVQSADNARTREFEIGAERRAHRAHRRRIGAAGRLASARVCFTAGRVGRAMIDETAKHSANSALDHNERQLTSIWILRPVDRGRSRLGVPFPDSPSREPRAASGDRMRATPEAPAMRRRPDHARQREEPPGRVELEVRQLRRRQQRDDADHGQRRPLFHRRPAPERGCRQRRHRRNVVDVAARRRRALRSGAAQGRPRRRLLDRWHERPDHHRDAGLPARRARRQDRHAGSRLRQGRRRRSLHAAGSDDRRSIRSARSATARRRSFPTT